MASSKPTQPLSIFRLLITVARNRRERAATISTIDAVRPRRFGVLRGFGAALRDLGDARTPMLSSFDDGKKRRR